MKRLIPLVCAAVLVFATSPIQSQNLSSETLSGLRLRNIGPANMSGRIVDLAVVEDNTYTIFAASSTGGVWKSTNNGINWKPIFEKEGTHSVGDIAIHQPNPDIIWVGTGERANRQSSGWGDGVYKTTDGGKTWKNMGLKDSHHIGRIVIHPDNPDIVYVAAMGHLWGPNEERGLYMTNDGGESWERLIYVDENTGVVDVAMDPGDPNTLYAATYQRRRRPYGFHGGGPGSGLHKSTDGGKTWKELRTGLPEGDYGRIGISIYRSNPNIVYASVEQGFQYNASTAYNERRAGLYRSEDKGESWTFMSDWNPRPMYASQPLVDPSDDQRVYMMNQFSYSDDGGKKFISPRQSLHGDDRILWVNPKDSRHVIKGDDGGIGISYDRAKTWLFVTNLPLSQFYRVSVDMEEPYNVYGGLQDNGSWYGPNATYDSRGILNSDWKRTGGGDGFLSLVHHTDPDIVYGESQYLGLFRLNKKTRQSQSIRPGDPKGRIGPRRNWDAWGPGIPEPELGNAMAPGNWDGPFYLSHHDPNTIYAGTNILWKSTDGGANWTSLGDLTTKVNRRELLIMGQRADTSTASLDDGIPYYPTLTAVAESPLKAGMLYVGTDDGLLQVSSDDGNNWTDVTSRLSGLPKETWINTIEPSSHFAGTAYVAINNYRNNDFNNYIYKTTDFGQSWTSIEGDLPEGRVARTLREDPKNPNLLYLGTEIGLFVSINGGRNWVELKNNMPTLPFNDLVIHPRDNDLVLGTHGRGVWILDNLNSLQGLTTNVLNQQAALFEIPKGVMINYSSTGAHTGDMFYRGQNPQYGALIDYYLKSPVAKGDIKLTIHDMSGKQINEVKVDTTSGIHRAAWDMTYTSNIPPMRFGNRTFPVPGPRVVPSLYVAKLTVNGESMEQTFNVEDDPRIDISIADRTAYTAMVLEVSDLMAKTRAASTSIRKVYQKVNKLEKDNKKLSASAVAEIKELNRMYGELSNRARSLYFQVAGYIGIMTGDQKAQFAYYNEMLDKLAPRKDALMNRTIPQLNRRLKGDDRIVVDQE